MDTNAHLKTVHAYTAANYAPLPVVVAEAEGAWVTDVDGRRYLDLLAAYSALSFGHANPRLLAVAHRQLDRLTLTSRAFHNDQMGPFCEELATLCGYDVVLPMNTGAEAVETAIKTARKWGYERRGVPDGEARIVVCEGNFHGRTTTIISFSTDDAAHRGFGPYTPGFDVIPYGDADALRAAIGERTVAFLVEPVQGERGVVLPPDGYLATARQICSEAGVLLIADEVQSGLGRTGRLLAVDHEDVRPDLLVLGKALGGGLYPVSAVVGDREVMQVFTPGTHGSTFGGNPLAAAIGREVVAMLREGALTRASAELGEHLLSSLRGAAPPAVTAIRGRGLWIGIDLDATLPARIASERLLERGVLCKETHERTLRIAPPLSITRSELDWGIERLVDALR